MQIASFLLRVQAHKNHLPFTTKNALKLHVSDAFTTRADSSSDTFFSLKLGGDVFALKHTTKELSKLDFNTLLHNSAFNIYFEELLTLKNMESPGAYAVKDICKALSMAKLYYPAVEIQIS